MSGLSAVLSESMPVDSRASNWKLRFVIVGSGWRTRPPLLLKSQLTAKGEAGVCVCVLCRAF